MISYTVRMDSDIPYYKQLVDAIHADIASGRLAPGEKLPTVRALADTSGLACGTVKRAYDELEQLGDLELSRGRGTFVRYRPEHSESHKERAMAAIDRLLDELEGLGLSRQETEIFIKLKQEERAARQAHLRVGFVECNREVLMQVTEQLRTLEGVELTQYLLSDVAAYPYAVSDDMDVIVTTAAHYDALFETVPAREKLLPVALRLAPETILSLAKLVDDARVGVLCHSRRFSNLLETALPVYAPKTHFAGTWLFDAGAEVEAALDGVDALLVPEGYEAYCSTDACKKLAAFAPLHPLVVCRYQIDQGSCLYLAERVKNLREARGLV